ncbi:hypothetical protein XA68_11522 [Ophiocordyceps unilateralis]|uniref:DH domain-containing protein n=1 Tax=Ophiocordyceps unilateralis TaxID=268505 RepID=A0A2A9PFC6_OPHUN|nr:hypothetical protein XA68_11522 [Ophiocordyceps unilateralis]
MVRVAGGLVLAPDAVSLYHAPDALLGHLPLLVFHGPSTTANYTLNSSRVQIHVVSPAGFASYPRITISPSNACYAVVNYLPREFQGDELYRALAFGLFKYFCELPDAVKAQLAANAAGSSSSSSSSRSSKSAAQVALFGEQHAADVVKSMVKSDNAAAVIAALHEALQPQHLTNVDVDLVLPPGSVVPLTSAHLDNKHHGDEEIDDDDDDDDEDVLLDPSLRQYGSYMPLVRLFGEPVFLPTAKLRRAPSKPTTLNRSKSFSSDQKLELRMKLAELVDTEDRYVAKLTELVNRVAADFRVAAAKRPSASLSPSEEELARLFPPSADQILRVNSAFLEQLKKVMDETEDEAFRDLESAMLQSPRTTSGGPARAKDPSGALAVARLFLDWFPSFTDCYQDYIRASQHFPSLLNTFLDRQSSFRERVGQAGEQTIRSILIEPVQRLPRYSLLIDQIVASLPMVHPALQPMLRARDIITNICSMDDAAPDKPHVAGRLSNMVEAWPADLEPQGRLIVAADFTELAPPYQYSPGESADGAGALLLFADCVVVLAKTAGASMTGRDLLREIDKPSAAELLMSMTKAAGGGPSSYAFTLTGWHRLSDVRFTESADGSMVWMTSTQPLRGARGGEHASVGSSSPTSRCFILHEALEGKAAKWTEDVVKARVEARFPDREREDPCWSLRSVRMHHQHHHHHHLDGGGGGGGGGGDLGLHVAVFQEAAHHLVEGRREPAPIRVVVDHDKGTKGAPVGHYGVEIVVNVASRNMKRLSMLTVGLGGVQFQDDNVALDDFLPTMSRRVIQLLGAQSGVANPQLAAPLVSYYTKTLRGLSLSGRAEKTRSFLPSSPVKLISSLWASTSHQNAADAAAPAAGNKPQRPPSLHHSDSSHSVPGSVRGREDGGLPVGEDRPENPLVRLEQTFTGYIAALQGRKGAIVGRTLLNRSAVDELTVNDLYNRLIESPFDFEAATADVGTNAVLAAFEKFLGFAWTGQIGPVMTKQALDSLQERANKKVPGHFADFVQYLFREMAPQNRRAFTALIKLLADLLDGCGNDGDRGALTLAFAELLVTDGSAPDYINLLDRLVEDCDRVFDGLGTRVSGADSMLRQARAQTGSLTSNASSLRRKFGLDMLLRQNPKDVERPSMWRSLSRHHRHPAESSSSSSLSRASRLADGPPSRERPALAGAFDDAPQRPASSHRLEFPLDTIGEPTTGEGGSGGRQGRKRRSSLSDLNTLLAATTIGDQQPLQTTKQTSGKVNASSTPPVSTPKASSRLPVSPRTPRQKENWTETAKPLIVGPPLLRPDSPTKGSINKAPESSSRRGHSKTLSTSSIPTLKAMKPADCASRPNSPARATTATNKLRLQSPQRVRDRDRDRVQAERRATHEAAEASLQSELAKIGQDLARARDGDKTEDEVRRLAAAVKALEERVQRDMVEAEAKLRAMDQLHKEAVAENELVYEKFNSELGKIVKAVKGKGKDDREELVERLREQGEETARLKKENARLKRDILSLRAAVA